MADHKNRLLEQHGRHDRSAHIVVLLIAGSHVEYNFIRLADGAAKKLDGLFLRKFRSRKPNLLPEGIHSQLAGDVASLMSAHTVGDDRHREAPSRYAGPGAVLIGHANSADITAVHD